MTTTKRRPARIPVAPARASKPAQKRAAPAVPKIRPREPLTKKARAAIERYVLVRCGPARIISFLINYTLEAERMYRANLYEWLEARGWRWSPRKGWYSIRGDNE